MKIPSEYPDHDFNNGLGLRCIPMLISTMGWGCVVSRCWFSAEQAQQPRNDNKNLRSRPDTYSFAAKIRGQRTYKGSEASIVNCAQ